MNEEACTSERLVVKFGVQYVLLNGELFKLVLMIHNWSEIALTHKQEAFLARLLFTSSKVDSSPESVRRVYAHSETTDTPPRPHACSAYACANTHEWEIPSKNSTLAVLCEHIPAFFRTSRCWNESQIYSCWAVLKIQRTLKLAINLPRRRILHVSLYPC